MKDTENEKPLVAVVGAGYWGKNLLRNFHALGALALICEKDREQGKALSEQYGEIPLIGDFDKVLVNDNIPCVALGTPAATHFEMARKALKAGKDVFVEKPLALNVREGEKLVNLAKDNDKLVHSDVIAC